MWTIPSRGPVVSDPLTVNESQVGELMQLQRRMANAVMQPLTANETMRLQREDCTPMQDEAAAFIKPNDRLTSFERLEIYNRQYWFRLYSAFEEDFPGLQAVLGNIAFEQLMHTYLEACPSASYTLRNLGARLAGWLEENPSWIEPRRQLALDMTRLEWAHIEAYDAAELPILTPEYMAAINVGTHLHLQPYVHLLEVSYPVDDLLIQVRHEAGSSNTSSNNAAMERKLKSVPLIEQIEPAHLYLAIHRQQFMVYYKQLAPEEYRLLRALKPNEPMGLAIDIAFVESQIAEQDRGALVQQIFQAWATLGWLCHPQAVSPPTV